jgi:hypothetical protein
VTAPERAASAADRNALACPRTIAASVKSGGTEPVERRRYWLAAASAAANSARFD